MFNKVFKAIDRVYYDLRDRCWGFAKGYAMTREVGYAFGFDDGLEAGESDTLERILNKLESKNPKLNNAEFQLGYAQAVAIVKGDI
jgi:hypothetical protein